MELLPHCAWLSTLSKARNSRFLGYGGCSWFQGTLQMRHIERLLCSDCLFPSIFSLPKTAGCLSQREAGEQGSQEVQPSRRALLFPEVRWRLFC